MLGRALGSGEPSRLCVIYLVWWHPLPRSCFSYIPGRASVKSPVVLQLHMGSKQLSISLLPQRHSSTCPMGHGLVASGTGNQLTHTHTFQNIHTFQSYPCLRCLSPTSTCFTAHSHQRDARAQPAVVLPARRHQRRRWRGPLPPPSARPGPRPGGAYRRASPLLLLTPVSLGAV